MQIQTNRNQRELKSHGDVSFPILVSHESITSYELNTFTNSSPATSAAPFPGTGILKSN